MRMTKGDATRHFLSAAQAAARERRASVTPAGPGIGGPSNARELEFEGFSAALNAVADALGKPLASILPK